MELNQSNMPPLAAFISKEGHRSRTYDIGLIPRDSVHVLQLYNLKNNQ